MTRPRAAWTALALIVALAYGPRAAAQVCSSNQDGTSSIVISESNPQEALNSNFCDGDPGLDFCATTQGILLDLELSGVANVDITCELTLPSERDRGRICIATDGCEESEFVPARQDDTHIRLVGDLLPSTNYKIAVFDIGSDANFCTGSPDLKVTCTGNFGSEAACFPLSTKHTPGDGGANPTASPARSGACPNNGEYEPGERITVAAAPSDGWQVARWQGTDNDSSASTENTLSMPARRHEVLVVYTLPVVAFDSGFETKGFCDWSTRVCDDCNAFSCHLADGQITAPLASYQALDAGEHRGVLSGPLDVDFDLILEWWNGSDWIPVASRLSPASFEDLTYQGEPGFYRWQVVSAAGSGIYELAIDYPGLSQAESNHLDQTKKPRKQGKRSLEAIFDRTSKKRDYLIDLSPGIGPGETGYEASFWVRPRAGLLVKGKKHQIFQLQQTQGVSRAQPIVELFLQAVRGQKDRYGVSVRARTDGGGKPKSPLVAALPADEWTRLTMVWQAASGPSQEDGLVELYVGDTLEWSIDLSNASQAVDRVLLGQITKGSKKTSGIVYFDDFRSSWEN
jgi:hypothetical protein